MILMDGSPMSFRSVLRCWTEDKSFRTFYSRVLSESSFAGFRWETPPLTTKTVSQAFEFVLVNSPGFCKRKTDPVPFRKKFEVVSDRDVITFPNLRGDATMIVPTPRADESVYGHLAAFIRGAPTSQVDSMWQCIGRACRSHLSDSPKWLSTAGGGVAWLHVRIDSKPKYYNYKPYTKR